MTSRKNTHRASTPMAAISQSVREVNARSSSALDRMTVGVERGGRGCYRKMGVITQPTGGPGHEHGTTGISIAGKRGSHQWIDAGGCLSGITLKVKPCVSRGCGQVRFGHSHREHQFDASRLCTGAINRCSTDAALVKRISSSSIGTKRGLYATGRRLRQAMGLMGFTSGPMRYVFSSWLRNGGGGLREFWSAFYANQLGPDSMPVVRAQVPAHYQSITRLFNQYTKLSAWDSPILFGGKLRQVDWRCVNYFRKFSHAASWHGVQVCSEFHDLLCDLRNS